MQVLVVNIVNGAQLYAWNYLFLLLAIAASVYLHSRNNTSRGKSKNQFAVLLSVSGLICSFILLVTYYVVIYSFFRDWTSDLDIRGKLYWLDLTEAGELVVKYLALLLPIIFALLLWGSSTIRVLRGSPRTLTWFAAVELLIVTLIVGTATIVQLSFMNVDHDLMIVGNSGAVYNNTALTWLIRAIVIIASELVFRRILMDGILDDSKFNTIFGVVVIWLGSSLFINLNWPHFLTVVLVGAGATWLYVRWRSLALCLVFRFLLFASVLL